MEVTVLHEAGYEQALMGMAASYKDTSLNLAQWWTPEAKAKAEKRAPKLAHKDGGHNKFLEHIELWVWVRASRNFWSQADTYRLASKQSESTMHTLSKKGLTQADFNTPVWEPYLQHLNKMIADKASITELKDALPEGFLQAREFKLSYKTLRNIIHQRETHRLAGWPEFCEQILAQVEHPYFLRENSR